MGLARHRVGLQPRGRGPFSQVTVLSKTGHPAVRSTFLTRLVAPTTNQTASLLRQSVWATVNPSNRHSQTVGTTSVVASNLSQDAMEHSGSALNSFRTRWTTRYPHLE